MQRYEGTKRLAAQPMTRGDYNAYRDWSLPDGENPLTPGYLVEYEDGGKANDPRHVGYISWSPADVFERTYKPIAATDTSDSAIEREIQAKGLTAPRVTPADIEANIDDECYFTAAEGVLGATRAEDPNMLPMIPPATHLLTFCVLVLKNGFTVTGESACASPENFDAEVGRKIARANAVGKAWPLMGYALKQALHDAGAGA